MQKQALITSAWIALSATTFTLGWILKPEASIGRSAKRQDSLRAGRADALSGLPTSPNLSSAQIELLGAGHTGRALTGSNISRLGELFGAELDPIKRRRLFLDLIEGMTVENAREVREQIAHLPANSQEFREFHYAWGKIAGVDAIMDGADTRKPDMVVTLSGWASADPTAARDWFASLDKKSEESFANQEYLKMTA